MADVDVRELLGMARQGLRVFRRTEVLRRLGPVAALKLGRDMMRGVRGPSAVLHLHALSDPLRPALVCGEVRLSYGELEARINQLSHVLARLGIGPGDKLGGLLHNSHVYVELNGALGLRGGVHVQIGYRLKGHEVAYMLQNSEARALIFHGDLAPVVEEALRELGPAARVTRERCVAVGGAPGFSCYEELLKRGDPDAPALSTAAGEGGLMVYTSGTTGKAKGATRDLKMAGLAPLVHFMAELPLDRDERHLIVGPLYHSAPALFCAITMMIGGCVVILEHFEPEAALRAIERERITSVQMVPTMLTRLVALGESTIRKYDLSSLRFIMSGAAPLPTELARRVEDLLGPILYNFYGATETSIVTIARPGEHTARPGTIGRLVGGNRVRLLDGDGRDVPDGQVGELYVKSRMLMRGYYGNDAATRAAMRDGYFSVGDLAWRDADGFYYLADRKHDMVISGGVNIYPWEIEQRLHEHPAIEDAAVVGVPDPEWGESLVAFVVVRGGQRVTVEELEAHVREQLADFKRPRRYLFVDQLPRNPTGKILKRELKERAQAERQAAS